MRSIWPCGSATAFGRNGLAGSGGGTCELRGRKLLFLDLDLGPDEQLEQLIAALRKRTELPTLPMPQELRELLQVRKIA